MNVAYVLDVVRGNIVLRLRSILGYNTEILRMRIHTRGCYPITQKHTASTYATSTVTLLDN